MQCKMGMETMLHNLCRTWMWQMVMLAKGMNEMICGILTS